MAAPTYSAGTLGNIVGGTSGVSVAHSTNVAGLVDLSTKLAGYLSCLFLTGSSAITVALTFALYRIAAANASAGFTTLASGLAAGATSLSVNSANGFGKNCSLFIVPAAGGLGEILTVSNISGTTLTVNAAVNTYATNDYVYLITQTAYPSITPGSSWAANTQYGSDIFVPGNSLYAAQVKNADATNAVTAFITLDTNPAFS